MLVPHYTSLLLCIIDGKMEEGAYFDSTAYPYSYPKSNLLFVTLIIQNTDLMIHLNKEEKQHYFVRNHPCQ